MLALTLGVFQECVEVDDIVLVVQARQTSRAETLIRERGYSKVTAVVPGGEHRQDSVRSGLSAIPSASDIVVIHDGARPLITEPIISASIEAARMDGAAIAAVPVIDTIKSSEDGRFIAGTLDREKLHAVQTPQTFAREVILAAYDRAYAEGYIGTDDASLVERMGKPVRIVAGSYENIKVTTPADVGHAEAILARRSSESGARSAELAVARIGHGYDVHRFARGRRLVLGGVEFPGEEGLLGHSDADVLLHAVTDAVLGAIGAGDIGRHFPDTDPQFKDVSSVLLLERVAKIAEECGWRIANIDTTLIAERPRISGHADEMRSNIARALSIPPGCVSVKGKTAEGLGPIGERLGIECHAVALVVPR